MSILTLEVIQPFSLKRNGQVTTCFPGERLQLPPDKAQRVLKQVGGKVRLLQGPPVLFPRSEPVQDGYIPMPGTPVRWERADGSRPVGVVSDVVIDANASPPIVVFVSLHDGGWAAMNPRVVRLEVLVEQAPRS